MKTKGTLENKILTIVDVETTGMTPERDRIIDIGIIRVENGVVTKTYSTLVDPGVHIPHSITRITGISNDTVARAPSFDEIAGDVEALFDGAVFVAHNASFDYGFIKNEFRRLGITFSKKTLCSVKLSRHLFPRSRSHNLDAIIERIGAVCEERHRAYPDADVIWQFLCHSRRTFGDKKVDRAIERLLGSGELPSGLPRTSLSRIPDTPGVYFFYDKEGELLYVGKSKNIRTRVRSHFSNKLSGKEVRLSQETVEVVAEKTPGELSALLLESSLIKRESPHYNRALRDTRGLVVATAGENEKGYKTLSYAYVNTLETQGEVIGIFRTLSQAKAKLRDIAKEHSLCEKLLSIEKAKTGCFGYSLGTCKGACVANEEKEAYNKRFTDAFRARRLRTWPYPGAIMIEEKGERPGEGIVFFIDEWRLKASFRYEDGVYSEFLPASDAFEYDAYKILVRFINNRSNRRAIKLVNRKECDRMIAELSHSFEYSISYDA